MPSFSLSSRLTRVFFRNLRPALALLVLAGWLRAPDAARAAVAATPSEQGPGLELHVRWPVAWSSYYFMPVHVEIMSPVAGTFRLDLPSQDWGPRPFRVRREVTLAAGETVFLEIPHPGLPYSFLVFDAEGRRLAQDTAAVTFFAPENGRRGRRGADLLCDVEGRHLGAFREAADRFRAFRRDYAMPYATHPLALADLPRYWQSYAGFNAVLLLDSRDALRLEPAQRRALERWVKWLGGRLWLTGPDHRVAAETLGFAAALRTPPLSPLTTPRFFPAISNADTGALADDPDHSAEPSDAGETPPPEMSPTDLEQWKFRLPDRHRYLTGELWLQEDADPDAWIFPLGHARNSRLGVLGTFHRNLMSDTRTAFISPAFRQAAAPAVAAVGEGEAEKPFQRLFGILEDLRFSAPMITIVLLLLGLAIGPLNLLFVRRRKNPLLFFVTTPLIAVVGTGAVFAASMIGEGLTVRYAEAALLARRDGDEDALLLTYRAVFSGLGSVQPRYADDVVVLPHRVVQRSEPQFITDLFPGEQRLGAGWIAARAPEGLFTLEPVTARMEIEVVPGGAEGEYDFVNGLSHTLIQVAAAVPDGYIVAENIPPGGRVSVKVRPEAAVFNQLRHDAFTDVGDPLLPGARLVAQCAGLPYLGDAGLGGTKVAGVYYYLALERPEDRP